MNDLFSVEVRRNPYPAYDFMRRTSPVYYVPPPFDGWMIFSYPEVKRALNENETFSSKVPAPPHWFIFSDPPGHTRLRALISQAFTPRMVANLEPRIRQISRELLDKVADRSEIDLAAEYSVPLPMMVISEMFGMPPAEWPQFKRWSDGILKLSYTRSGGEEAAAGLREFTAVTEEMNEYLTGMIAQRRAAPQDDLLTRLMQAEVNGERLSQPELLGFFQLLMVAGQETTTNLINNAILCLIENPNERTRLEQRLDLLPMAIEEVLRYRSPVQWMMRTPRHDVEILGTVIPAGKLVLPVIGSANHDPQAFPDPERFDITRDPNPHIAFGHGMHFCLGAPLSRLEARIALTDVLERLKGFEYAVDEPWEPRQALHVHGPTRLPIRFEQGIASAIA
jgi:cytochrome P450